MHPDTEVNEQPIKKGHATAKNRLIYGTYSFKRTAVRKCPSDGIDCYFTFLDFKSGSHRGDLVGKKFKVTWHLNRQSRTVTWCPVPPIGSSRPFIKMKWFIHFPWKNGWDVNNKKRNQNIQISRAHPDETLPKWPTALIGRTILKFLEYFPGQQLPRSGVTSGTPPSNKLVNFREQLLDESSELIELQKSYLKRWTHF